jgi:hypothetical protein
VPAFLYVAEAHNFRTARRVGSTPRACPSFRTPSRSTHGGEADGTDCIGDMAGTPFASELSGGEAVTVLLETVAAAAGIGLGLVVARGILGALLTLTFGRR